MKILMTIAIVGLTAATIAAQTGQKLIQSQKDNERALLKYEWKSRTQIQKDGETKRDELLLVRYDSTGELQKAVIAKMPEPELPSRGLRGLIAKNKKKDFMEKLEELRAIGKSYSELPPDKMNRFLVNATVTTEQSLIRMKGYDVLQAGDSMTIWIDAVSKKKRRVEIFTTSDGKPLRIVSEFQDISQLGPTYLSKNQVNYNGNAIVVLTQNFDYTLVKPTESAAVN